MKEEVEKLKIEIEKSFKKVKSVLIRRRDSLYPWLERSFETCFERKDAQLLQDKAKWKKAGLAVERRGDIRWVVTEVGTVSYQRTYYVRKAGGYCYPIGQVAELVSYQWVSTGVGLGAGGGSQGDVLFKSQQHDDPQTCKRRASCELCIVQPFEQSSCGVAPENTESICPDFGV